MSSSAGPDVISKSTSTPLATVARRVGDGRRQGRGRGRSRGGRPALTSSVSPAARTRGAAAQNGAPTMAHSIAVSNRAGTDCCRRRTRWTACDHGTERGRTPARRRSEAAVATARIDRDLTLRESAARSACPWPPGARLERGVLEHADVMLLARMCAVVGLDLAVRTYPGGQPIRDAAHLALRWRLSGARASNGGPGDGGAAPDPG